MQKNFIVQCRYFDTMSRAQKGYARLMEPVCKKWDLTRNELDVILFLANNPDYDRAVDIVNSRGLSKSHVSLSVGSLEKRGLLYRQDDPFDRRTVHLKMTESAVPIVTDGQKAQQQFWECLHRGVSGEQLEMMADFTRKVSENIKNIEEFL